MIRCENVSSRPDGRGPLQHKCVGEPQGGCDLVLLIGGDERLHVLGEDLLPELRMVAERVEDLLQFPLLLDAFLLRRFRLLTPLKNLLEAFQFLPAAEKALDEAGVFESLGMIETLSRLVFSSRFA